MYAEAFAVRIADRHRSVCFDMWTEYGERFSVHQLRPQVQTGTQVSTTFQDRVALKTEVVDYTTLSQCAGIDGKSEWDDADQQSGSVFPQGQRQNSDTGLRTTGTVAKQLSIGHRKGARGNSADACFRDIKKAWTRDRSKQNECPVNRFLARLLSTAEWFDEATR